MHLNERAVLVFADPFCPLHYATGCTLHSLELELPSELILSLLQLLPAPHVLIIHVLGLGFDALELSVQLQRGENRGRERRAGGRESMCKRERDTERVG